jgi:hypothetical protein
MMRRRLGDVHRHDTDPYARVSHETQDDAAYAVSDRFGWVHTLASLACVAHDATRSDRPTIGVSRAVDPLARGDRPR